jgi:hypothetical protein
MRLLVLMRRQLDAADARIEIGGSPSDDEHIVWCALGPHRRLVAVFDEPPSDVEAKLTRLEALAEAFRDTVETPAPPSTGDGRVARLALDDELEGICQRSDAHAVFIVDPSSPIIWGRSHEALGKQVDELLADADDDGIRGVAARSLRAARAHIGPSAPGPMRHVEHGDGYSLLLRSIAGAYLLILAFDGPFAEPTVDGIAKRSLTRLERLIARLPPIDPPPKGGRVLQLLR